MTAPGGLGYDNVSGGPGRKGGLDGRGSGGAVGSRAVSQSLTPTTERFTFLGAGEIPRTSGGNLSGRELTEEHRETYSGGYWR